MAYLNDLEKVRGIEWGRKYLWDIRFDSAPSPFDQWFPAIEVSEPTAVLESYKFDGFMSQYSVPLRSGLKKLSITFVDDVNQTLAKWMTDWINSKIQNNGRYVSSLSSSVKLVQILKLNSNRAIIDQSGYWVYPETEFKFEGSNDSAAPQYSVPFVIVGTAAVKPVEEE